MALRLRTDLNEYKVGGAFASGMDALVERVKAMDLRIAKLEKDRAALLSFCSKMIAHFGGCGFCQVRVAERESLQKEFDKVIREISS
jgi:hypothetical protein